MHQHSYISEAIVLGRRNFGEADRILSLYTKNFGRISIIAKGARRPKSRKRGHIEVFSYLKFQAAVGHGMGIMTEAEIIDDFKEIRTSLKKISLAYYIAEVVGKITHEDESNIILFDLILDVFKKLKNKKRLKELRFDFVSKLLVLMGYFPEGEVVDHLDEKLEEVIEKKIYSQRVGKIMLK